MNDIIPPKKRPEPPMQLPSGSQISSAPPVVSQKSIDRPVPSLLLPSSRRRSVKKIVLWVIGGIFAFLLLAAISLFVWYKIQLSPVSGGNAVKIRVQILAGTSPTQIGQLLEEKKIIHNHVAFDIYTRLTGAQSQLRAGVYSLSPSQSTEQIVAHLISGKTDELKITFLPGATLAENRTELIKAGYSEQAVDRALGKTYDHPLFAGKPAGSDLEGYIFGETYHFDRDVTVEQILTRTFDEYYKVITDNNLIAGFQAQGLNVYQGITLASIIQREVSRPDDQKQVAQVFYTRMGRGMPLGADATFVYAAKKLGITPSPLLDSPYNTRKYAGLPPGPIASPGLGALQAVAAPAAGDYLFFVSGDDGVSHFSHTQDEHEAATRQYCQKNCTLF